MLDFVNYHLNDFKNPFYSLLFYTHDCEKECLQMKGYDKLTIYDHLETYLDILSLGCVK